MKLENFDQLFYQRARHSPIIINDFQEHKDEKRKAFDNLIFTRYQPTDVLSNIPSCSCGFIIGQFNKGIVCTKCNTPVENPMDQDIQSLIWLRAPLGVKKLINPMVWTMLSNHFKKGKFNVIQWLCDRDYRLPPKPPKSVLTILSQIDALNIPRGYNNFCNNFAVIIEKLLKIRDFRKEKRRSRDLDAPLEKIQEILIYNPDCIFSEYLPLPNKALLVVEDTSLSTFVDPIVTGAIDAIKSMVGLDDPLINHSPRTRENRTVRAIAQLATFYRDFYSGTLAAKEGIARKHLFGTRCYFSFRSVISSLPGPHHREELHIPWGVGIGLLRVHLLSLLYRLKYTPNKAVSFLNEHAQKYHPLIDQMFKDLIAASPFMGLPTIFQRNPSLERGSMQRKFITRVKTDCNDPTVSLSILTVKGYNADPSAITLSKNFFLFLEKGAVCNIQKKLKVKNTLAFI